MGASFGATLKEREAAPSQNGGGGELAALPPMVLVVQALLFPSLRTQRPEPQWSALGTGPLAEGSTRWSQQLPDALVSIILDGQEVGRATQFPSGPVRITPRGPSSQLLLRFFLPAPPGPPPSLGGRGLPTGGQWELTAVVGGSIADATRFGAPLLASLWFGLPSPGSGGGVATAHFEKALARAQDPEAPKALVSLYRAAARRPSPDPDTPSALLPQPDVAAAMAAQADEGLEFCAGARTAGRGPSPSEQVQGVIRALGEANELAIRLQGALFSQLEGGPVQRSLSASFASAQQTRIPSTAPTISWHVDMPKETSFGQGSQGGTSPSNAALRDGPGGMSDSEMRVAWAELQQQKQRLEQHELMQDELMRELEALNLRERLGLKEREELQLNVRSLKDALRSKDLLLADRDAELARLRASAQESLSSTASLQAALRTAEDARRHLQADLDLTRKQAAAAQEELELQLARAWAQLDELRRAAAAAAAGLEGPVVPG